MKNNICHFYRRNLGFNPYMQVFGRLTLIHLLVLISNVALAECIEDPQNPGKFTCVGTDDDTQSLNVSTGDLDVTAAEGYVLDTDDDLGFDLKVGPNGADLKFIQNKDGLIKAVKDGEYGESGIRANNAGTGSISIETLGGVIGGSSIGNRGDGINVQNSTNGEDILIIQTSGYINGKDNAIKVDNYGLNLNVIQKEGGIIGGGIIGIMANNEGMGSTVIEVAGEVNGSANHGIKAINSIDSKDLIITQEGGAITSNGNTGIYSENNGDGNTVIETRGLITGGIYGIQTFNNGDSLSLVQKAGTITSHSHIGISATNNGVGSIFVNTAGNVSAEHHGIYALNPIGSDDLNIVQTAGSIISGKSGIFATTSGSGLNITQEIDGSIKGEEYGILAINSGSGPTNIKIGGLLQGGSSAIFLDEINIGSAEITITETGQMNNLSKSSGDLVIGTNEKNFITNISNLGQVTGSIDLGDVDNTFTNKGTWDTAGGLNRFGSGTNIFTNDGLVIAANTGATATVTTEFNGMSEFRNNANGVLSMANGVAGDRTIIDGDYIGDGGTIKFDTVLGDDSSITDFLQINGDVSGNSFVEVENVNGTGAQTVDGIKIIGISGISPANAFTLIGDYEHEGEPAIASGAYAYKLYHDGDWYLRSHENGDSPTPTPTPTPLYQAGVPSYESYPQTLLNLNALGTLQQRVGNRVWSDKTADNSDIMALGSKGPKSYGFWGRIEGGHSKMKPHLSTSSSHYRQDIYKLQTGFDGVLSQNAAGNVIGGISAHYAHGKSNIRSSHGNGQISTDGYGLGGSLTWYGNNDAYIDAQAQATWYRSDLNSSLAQRNLVKDNRGFGYALSLEGGKRINIAPNWSITPQAQLTYSRVKFNDFTDAFDARVSLAKGDSLQGRVGGMISYENDASTSASNKDRSHVYGVFNLHNEFLSGTRVSVSDDFTSVDFKNRKDRLSTSAGLGWSKDWSKGGNTYSIYGEATAETGLKHFGASTVLKAQVGFRMQW